MDLIDFALTHSIAPEDAYVLPALFDRAAILVGKTRQQLLREVDRNPALSTYLAECARKVAATA
jgi:hypothetical protein